MQFRVARYSPRRRYPRFAPCKRACRSPSGICELTALACGCVLSSNHRYAQQQKRTPRLESPFLLAGVARFELTNEGVKVPCLTAWRYPYDTNVFLDTDKLYHTPHHFVNSWEKKFSQSKMHSLLKQRISKKAK